MEAERYGDLITGAAMASARRTGCGARPRRGAVAALRNRAIRHGAWGPAWRVIMVVVLAAASLAEFDLGVGGAGAPLYPDLRTVPPTDLRFDQLEDGTHILRFANTVWNAGEGRLELQGNPKSKGDPNIVRKVYQNLYDEPTAGTRTSQRMVASDTVYHPGHEHYHFANLASYSLLHGTKPKKNRPVKYKPTTKQGTKTSYCIIDTDLFEGAFGRMYTSCGRELQGMTPGWGDTYGANLIDQWVVLGSSSLADGEYAVRSQADPKNLLKEGGGARETNNTAEVYFTVQNGEITNVRDKP